MNDRFTTNIQEAVETLTTSDNLEHRLFGRLLATGILEEFDKFARAEQDRGTNYQDMICTTTTLCAHLIGNFFHKLNDEAATHNTKAVMVALEAMIVEQIAQLKEQKKANSIKGKI